MDQISSTNLSASTIERPNAIDAETKEHGVPDEVTEAPELL